MANPSFILSTKTWICTRMKERQETRNNAIRVALTPAGEIIGVAQLCNKLNGAGFSSFDEDIAQAFSVFCCMSIVHSLMYKRVREAQQRSRLSNELMIYHMQVFPEDVMRLTNTDVPKPDHWGPDMDGFPFTPRSIPYEETPIAMISMFDDMGFTTKYRIRRDKLAMFVLTARKGYRDPPYHNWAHAFAVSHFCYLMYKNFNLLNYIDEIEALALFVACICHDIDHRGTTNSFQIASDSILAALYSSEGSVLERHHFAQCMCILNSDDCNIFENLSRNEFEKVLDLMRDIILATDLAHHLRIIGDLEDMAKTGYKRDNRTHRMHLLFLLMTSCDLSDQTKHWKNTKKIANLIYQEFFSQGDMEKAQGKKPLEMMDRDKAEIPHLQISFLDSIALPVYRILAKIFPEAEGILGAVEQNRQMWVTLNAKLKSLNLPTNMDLFEAKLDDDCFS